MTLRGPFLLYSSSVSLEPWTSLVHYTTWSMEHHPLPALDPPTPILWLVHPVLALPGSWDFPLLADGVPGQQHQGPDGLQRHIWTPHVPNKIWFRFKSQSCRLKKKKKNYKVRTEPLPIETFLQNTKTLQFGCVQPRRKCRSRYLQEITYKYFPQNKWF